MTTLVEVPLSGQSIQRFSQLVGEAKVREAIAAAEALRKLGPDRTIWNVSSTAVGSGVAELLRGLLPYVRSAGINARWMVLKGTPEFFRIAKRIHEALLGAAGDGIQLTTSDRLAYEKLLMPDAQELLTLVRPGDLVVLHDPTTLALASYLKHAGATVVWRCHIGADAQNEQTARGWNFIAPFLRDVAVSVFSREAYIPPVIPRKRAFVIRPSINPFSAKNQLMDEPTARAILVHVGLVGGADDGTPPIYQREDGSPGRVDHCADVLRLGPAPAWDAPLIVQSSRWDRLEDPAGVLRAFSTFAQTIETHGAQLLLIGPNVNSIADDPDAPKVFSEVVEAWRALPHSLRRSVHLANLPTADAEENGAIVNALQRHAAILVQKSLREGFGLSVTEAMWKGRPVIASAVGGLQDQIEDGVSGLLLRDPTDQAAFGAALRRLLEDREFASRMGAVAHERVHERSLTLRHLMDWSRLLQTLAAQADVAAAAQLAM